MPSLQPRDGVDAPLCAGIRAGSSTISPVDSLSSVAGKSLPPPPAGEHEAMGCPSGAFGTSGPTGVRESTGPLRRVDGTLAHVIWGVNAIVFPTQLRVLQEHGGGIYPDGLDYSAVG